MIFQHYQLPTTLNKHIEALLYFKDFTPEHSIERIVPTGHIFLVFEFDNIPRNTFDNETLQPTGTFNKAWISGTHKKFITISAHQQSEMLVIQFKPAGAFPFFHFPLEELAGKVVAAEKFFGENIIQLRDEMLTASYEAKFSMIEEWLLKRYDETKLPSADLLHFVERLQQESSLDNYNELLRSYPSTQKQLIHHFKKYVGLTPKNFQRIVRFNEILKAINNKEKVSWTGIAYDCGFTDQSHFIKEFYLFSGFNPGEFIKNDLTKEEFPFLPLDKRG